FQTPSRKLELYSRTLKDWGWPDHTLPGHIESHVHPSRMTGEHDFVLVPTFRLPTLIHTRSGNSKWLNEISHSNPVWLHTSDARRLGLETGDAVRVSTEIGYFVSRAWVTEAIMPGVVACSHHLGRWRLHAQQGMERWSSALVDINSQQNGTG